MKKVLCILLSTVLLGASAVPALAANRTDSADAAPALKEGTYATNQVVVMFQNSAIDTKSVPKKGDLASVGASFGGYDRFQTHRQTNAVNIPSSRGNSRFSGTDF